MVESGEDALARAAGAKNEEEREQADDSDVPLITYAGIPVSLEEECGPGQNRDCEK